MRVPQRNRDGELAALAVHALRAHGATVQLRELPYEREADAGALVRATARALDAMEALEEPRQVRRGDPRTCVAHRELCTLGVTTQRDLDLAVERELERVREKIQHDLLPHAAIDVDRFSEVGTVDPQSETDVFDGGAEHARQLARVRGEIDRLVRRLDAAGLDA